MVNSVIIGPAVCPWMPFGTIGPPAGDVSGCPSSQGLILVEVTVVVVPAAGAFSLQPPLAPFDGPMLSTPAVSAQLVGGLKTWPILHPIPREPFSSGLLTR